MNKQELIQKIISKREFSQLPEKDVELAFAKFEKRQVSDEEKIRATRELLHKVFGAFASKKILSPKNKNEEWILRKHLSTRERLPYYYEIYNKILFEYKNKKISIIDLGAGVNRFSYKYFRKIGVKVNYLAIESVGQLVNLMNNYFEKNKLRPHSVQSDSSGSRINARAIHESLFNLEEIKEIIQKIEKPRIIFLFKVLDSLEMVKRDYSKELLQEITSLADKIVISFATASMIKRKRFKVQRYWILDFIKDNFEILNDFEIGGERYIAFKKK